MFLGLGQTLAGPLLLWWGNGKVCLHFAGLGRWGRGRWNLPEGCSRRAEASERRSPCGLKRSHTPWRGWTVTLPVPTGPGNAPWLHHPPCPWWNDAESGWSMKLQERERERNKEVNLWPQNNRNFGKWLLLKYYCGSGRTMKIKHMNICLQHILCV